jgi:hypothetical protein
LPPREVDEVRVFEIGDTTPNSAEPIGNVVIIDGGASSSKYGEVVQLARAETAKAGGNGLLITEHQKPSFWGSSSHQIRGVMLLLGDMQIDSAAPNPVMEAVTLMQDIREEQIRKTMPPKSTALLSVGRGWVSSRIETPSRTYSWLSGFEWKVEYNHIFKNYYGVGLQCSGFSSSLPEGTMSFVYIAPSFVTRMKFGDKWLWKGDLGMGYCGYSDGNQLTAGFGTNTTLGVEYMLTPATGLGAEISFFKNYYSTPDGFILNANEFYGTSRIALQCGMRFYF